MGEEAYNKALAISTTTADVVCLAGAVKNTVRGIRDAKAAKGMPEEVPKRIEQPNLADIEKPADLESVNITGGKGETARNQKVFTDNPFDEAGNLKPDISYQTGEFKYNYETDAKGRISNWNTDNLQLTERKGRLKHNSNTPGKIKGDHAGHLAGDRFGGSPNLDNIVSQSQNVNLSQYKKLENKWAKAIKEGKEVTVKVNIKYAGEGLRPVQFDVEYTIKGELFTESILN